MAYGKFIKSSYPVGKNTCWNFTVNDLNVKRFYWRYRRLPGSIQWFNVQ